MNGIEALKLLKDSDIAIYTEEGAKEICAAFSLPAPERVELLHWDTIEEARHKWGFKALFAPGNGVYGFLLIDYITASMGIMDVPYRDSEVEQTRLQVQRIEEKLIADGNIDLRNWWQPTQAQISVLTDRKGGDTPTTE